MFAKSAFLFRSFGVNYSMAPLKGGHKKFTVFAKSVSSSPSDEVNRSTEPLKQGGKKFTLTLGARYLTPTLLNSLSSELDSIKKEAKDGPAVLITTGRGSCFCEDFDTRYAIEGN